MKLKIVSQPLILLGLSISVVLHFLGMALFYIMGFQGMSVNLYEQNLLIAQLEFFLVLLGLSINVIVLKRYLGHD
jgi:hypothetical protein